MLRDDLELLLACLVLRRRASSRSSLEIVSVVLLLAAWPPLTWLTWHAIGEMEVGRHVLWATLMLYVGLAMATAWRIDAADDALGWSRGDAAAPQRLSTRVRAGRRLSDTTT
jgi:hypothetical protein